MREQDARNRHLVSSVSVMVSVVSGLVARALLARQGFAACLPVCVRVRVCVGECSPESRSTRTHIKSGRE